jgi:4-oxalocrotonate tautomerase
VVHVSIKHFSQILPDENRIELVLAVTRAVTRAFCCDEEMVSIALERLLPDQRQGPSFGAGIEERSQLLARTPN